MGMARNIAIYTVLQQQKQAQQQKAQQQKQTQQGTEQTSGNTAGNVNNTYGVGGETKAFNAGLLTFKKGKKEDSQNLGTSNFAAIDEHQGQILLG